MSNESKTVPGLDIDFDTIDIDLDEVNIPGDEIDACDALLAAMWEHLETMDADDQRRGPFLDRVSRVLGQLPASRIAAMRNARVDFDEVEFRERQRVPYASLTSTEERLRWIVEPYLPESKSLPRENPFR